MHRPEACSPMMDGMLVKWISGNRANGSWKDCRVFRYSFISEEMSGLWADHRATAIAGPRARLRVMAIIPHAGRSMFTNPATTNCPLGGEGGAGGQGAGRGREGGGHAYVVVTVAACPAASNPTAHMYFAELPRAASGQG
jgi:hypothetical protein